MIRSSHAAFAFAALLAAPAAAQVDNDCKTLGEIAELTSLSHQVGMSMAEAMDTVGEYLPDVVMRAYSSPRYQTHEAKLQETARFRDEIALECYRGEISIPPGMIKN